MNIFQHCTDRTQISDFSQSALIDCCTSHTAHTDSYITRLSDVCSRLIALQRHRRNPLMFAGQYSAGGQTQLPGILAIKPPRAARSATVGSVFPGCRCARRDKVETFIDQDSDSTRPAISGSGQQRCFSEGRWK